MALSSQHDQIFFLSLLAFLLLLPTSAFAQQTNTNITVGTSLTATRNSSPWLSPSGRFAFGFRQLPNQKDLFLLCVWYDKIPDKTVVWYANSDPVPMASTGSKVSLTSDLGLVLTDRQGKELWKSENILGEVFKGVMTDEGNFLLQDTSSETLWETFKNPTDTILPSQVIERGGMLSSHQSETNYSGGRFQLRLQQDGNLVLNSINLPSDYANSPYYASGTDEGTNSSTAGTQLVFNETGSIYVSRKNGGTFGLAPGDVVSASDNYIRATLNFDGVFAQYYHPKNGSGSWTYLWSIPDDICHDMTLEAGAGVCGYNSICTLNEDQRPKCDCPQNYSLIDPNDAYGDCKPDFIQGCEEDELVRSEENGAVDLYDVVEVINTDWPTSDYILLKPFTGDSCKEACLRDCLCAVAIFRDGTCWKKKLPLSNGRVDNSLNSRGFIKVRKPKYSILPNGSNGLVTEVTKDKDQDTLILVGSVLLGTSVFVKNILFAAAVCTGFYFIYQKKKRKSALAALNVSEVNLRCFTYKELEEATDGFKEELGSGAFGIVYKGTIQIGCRVVVAVKKLTFVAQESEKKFKNEVKVIGQTHHKNLVRLLGYCDDGQNRLLVYEYLSNGTLASFVFADIKPSWKERTEIALEIAKGLLYLHEECSTQIIHCDIKPQNILLDDYYNAKISDFGLAKLLMMNQSQTHTAIRGTKGYVAPEWFRNMPITTKVDVYSFGVVLLEIICCRRSVDLETNDERKEILTDWAYDCFTEGALNVLVDWEVEALDDIKKLETYVMVSMWCIQENPSVRPTMRKVVQMLEGVVEVHAPPCPVPAYSVTN